MTASTLQTWHQIVNTRDMALLAKVLADDVVFTSPVVHTPQHGKDIALMYLGAALMVLNNESFHYLNEWEGPSSAVLEFLTTVQGIEINGVDIIGWNSDGKISSFKVMVRPLKAMNLLHQMMGAMLAGGKSDAPFSTS